MILGCYFDVWVIVGSLQLVVLLLGLWPTTLRVGLVLIWLVWSKTVAPWVRSNYVVTLWFGVTTKVRLVWLV